VRMLFESREIVAGEGFFVDDFRGMDLYQRTVESAGDTATLRLPSTLTIGRWR
jgi:hypothetical protein